MSRACGSSSEFLTKNTTNTFIKYHFDYSWKRYLPPQSPQFFSNLRTPISGLTIHINPLDICFDLLAFQLSLGGLSSQPSIVVTPAYFKNRIHLLNTKFMTMIFDESQYLLSLLEKMLMAFFSISRSI